MRFLIVAALIAACVALKRYDGYQLLEVRPATRELGKVLQTLTDDMEIDVWAESHGVVDVFVAPHKLSAFRLALAQHEIAFALKNDRIQQDIDDEVQRLASRKRVDGRAINYDDYNTYAAIMQELDELVLRCPAGFSCNTFTIGNSYEGRDTKGITISGGSGRTAVWLDATIHAREWLGTATHLKITRHLFEDYATDAEVQRLLNTYDFHLLPVANPDGYEFTWTDDRLWRKNRSPNAGSACVGTDLNRNFAEEWGNAGTSTSPCSETYGGTGPASEVETQNLQNELSRVGSTLHTSVHIHTYAQLWLIPWGSVDILGNCNFADDHAEMLVVANAAADAIENTYNTRWERGNSCATIYPASGITMDYSKGVAGIKYTATPELRGNSFVAAPDQIEPSFQEVWNGLVAAIDTIP